MTRKPDLASLLNAEFPGALVSVGTGGFIPRDDWVNLGPLLVASREEVDSERVLDPDDGDVAVRELFGDRLLELLLFEWDGGISLSLGGFQALVVQSDLYLVYWSSSESYRVTAMLKPPQDVDVLRAALARALKSENTSWGSLPTLTMNSSPRSVPAELVRRAFVAWLGDGDEDQWRWQLLASEHFGRVIEPNSALRWLDVVEQIDWTSDEPVESRSPSLDGDARAKLFDEWWATAYREA
ncbi:MAG: hypothetical protein ACRDNP_08475 [Gaiellaceae bacterium]